jgi:hypothetical protein
MWVWAIARPALLLLVMKLKRVRVGKDGVEVDFHEYKPEMLGALRDTLGL